MSCRYGDGIWLAAVLSLALATVGCDGEEDPCAGLANGCQAVGDTRCEGSVAVQSCGETADGCLVWSTSETCGPREPCRDSGDRGACECLDECGPEGTQSCNGDVIVTCVADGDGCLYNSVTTNCTSTRQICRDSGDTAQCVVVCEDECETVGESACEEDDDTIVTCVTDDDGCLVLQVTEDCAATGHICDESGIEPECVGCGPCDAPGEYCDTSADPPECLMAGTVPEILEGVAPGTVWTDLDELTRLALAARAELTLARYREEFGPDALDAAVDAMLTAPSAEAEANYGAFLAATYEVSSVANAALDQILRKLYVVLYFARQVAAVNYHGLPPVTWDGTSAVEHMPIPDTESLDAYEALGAEIVTECEALRGDAGLTAEEAQILEAAMGLARQHRAGSLGYHFGGQTLRTLHGLGGWAWDFLLTYSDYGGAIYASDEEFLDQVNAYFFADLARLFEGSAIALDYLYLGFADEGEVAFFVGDPSTSRTAQLYLLLASFFYDRVMGDADILEPCLTYSAAEQAAIWEAFTADSFADNDGATTLASYGTAFGDYATERVEMLEDVMSGALLEVFPSEGAAMSVAERDAIVAAIEAAGSLGEAMEAFDSGLVAAGDGSAPVVLAAAVAGLTVIGGRDYADPVDGATWLAEDDAAVQAMWDEVRSWVLAEYGFAETALPEDLTTDADVWVMPGPWGLVFGLGEARTLLHIYRVLLGQACHLVSLDAGLYLIGPAYHGLSFNTEGAVLDRFLAATLPPAEAALLPLYYLLGVEGEAFFLGTTDGTIRRLVADACDPAGVVEWLRTTVADAWGVPDDRREEMLSSALLGPWYINIGYDGIAYRAILEYLQGRLDADYGAGTYSVDPFELQACDLWSPRADDETYAALVTCVVP